MAELGGRTETGLSVAPLAARVGAQLVAAARAPDHAAVREQLLSMQVVANEAVVNSVLAAVERELLGYGPLAPYLRPGVTDVLVNSPDSVWLDDGGGLRRLEVGFADEAAVRQLAVRLSAQAGRRLDDASPMVDAVMADGVRLHACLPPVSVGSTCISLRLPLAAPLPLTAWAGTAISSAGLAELLAARATLVISGATGSGKTTLLRSLLAALPAVERVVALEDVAELALPAANLVTLQGRGPNAEGAGTITLRDLVRQSLRMRPDRVVIGEVRGPEVLDWLLAASSGHPGSLTTVHAESGAAGRQRLRLLAQLAGLPAGLADELIGDAVDFILHCARTSRGREVVAVERLRGGP